MLQDLAGCVPGFAGAKALDHFVGRFPKAVTHFAPGGYDSFLRPRTSIGNVFAAGDWIVDAHGSFSQEKARPWTLTILHWLKHKHMCVILS